MADTSILDTLSPEQLQQLFGAEAVPDRQKILAQQLAQTQALAAPSRQQHSTGIGAALGGLGDAVGSIGGAIRGNQIRDQQQALIDQVVKAKMMGAQAGRPPGPMSMNDPSQGGPPSPLAQSPAADFSLTG